jgi:hypothetical protein
MFKGCPSPEKQSWRIGRWLALEPRAPLRHSSFLDRHSLWRVRRMGITTATAWPVLGQSDPSGFAHAFLKLVPPLSLHYPSVLPPFSLRSKMEGERREDGGITEGPV